MVISGFWLLQIKPLGTILYRFLRRCKFLFFQDKCPAVQLLSCMASVVLIFYETAKLFFRAAVPFNIPTRSGSGRDPLCLPPCQLWVGSYFHVSCSDMRAVVSHCHLNLHLSDHWLCDSLCTFPSGYTNLDPVLLEKQEELMLITPVPHFWSYPEV